MIKLLNKKHLVICLFFLTHHLNAQFSYEFKTNLFDLLNADPNLYLEVIPQPDLGIEFGLHYDRISNPVYFINLNDPIDFVDSIKYFDINSLSLILKSKKYFDARNKGHGVFLGPVSRLDLNIGVEKGFESTYYAANGRSIRVYTLSKWQMGIIGGYKFLFFDKLPLEASISLSMNMLHDRNQFDIDGFAFLKTGWRL